MKVFIVKVLKLLMLNLINFKYCNRLHSNPTSIALSVFKRYGLSQTIIITFFKLPNYLFYLLTTFIKRVIYNLICSK